MSGFYGKTRSTTTSTADSNDFYGSSDGRAVGDNTSATGESKGFYGTRTQNSYEAMEQLIENGDQLFKEIEDQTDQSLVNANSAEADAASAHTSMEAAKVSEDASKESELAAEQIRIRTETSEFNSSDSEDAAKASEDAAALSESHALTSENNAKASENEAKTSENNLAQAVVDASTSEANALASKNAAKASEDAAATSEANAQDSEDASAVSEANALASANDAEDSANIASDAATAVTSGVIPSGSWDASTGNFPPQPDNMSTVAAYRVVTGGTMTTGGVAGQSPLEVALNDVLYSTINTGVWYKVIGAAVEGFDQDLDYTVTGAWEFTQPIEGDGSKLTNLPASSNTKVYKSTHDEPLGLVTSIGVGNTTLQGQNPSISTLNPATGHLKTTSFEGDGSLLTDLPVAPITPATDTELGGIMVDWNEATGTLNLRTS